MKQRKILKGLCCLTVMLFVGIISYRTVEASANVEIPSEATLMSINGSASWTVVQENDGLYLYFLNAEGAGADECSVSISYEDSGLNQGNNCLIQLTWDFTEVKGGWYQDIDGAYAFSEVEDGQRWTRVYVPDAYLAADSFTLSCGQSSIGSTDIPGNTSSQEPEQSEPSEPDTPVTPGTETSETPAAATPEPPVSGTPEISTSETPETLGTENPEAPTSGTPETPASESQETLGTETQETPVPKVPESLASETLSASDLFNGGIVSGNIVVDGELQDWENVPGIYVGTDGIDSWKVAVSPDLSTLFICMNGVAVSEWDYNFQWKVLSFTAGDWTDNYQFANLASGIPGAQVMIKNGASGNVQGDYAVECSIPVSALPASNFLISLGNTNIWAVDVPVLDGMIKEPEDTPIPVYNGITIDGSFSDWAAVVKADGNCPSNEHPDCLEKVAMVFDGDYVYLYLESGDASNAFWSGSHSNSKFAITTDLGYTLLFTMNSDDTVSGVDGAGCKHYGNQAEIAIPKSVLPEYLKSISFGFYQQEPMIRDVVNLVAEEEKGNFTGIVYDGLYGDWKYYPHQLIEYATAGTQENVVDGEGALYTDGDTLFGHVKVVMNAHMNEWSTLFTQAVTFKFGEAESLTLYPRFITVDANGNMNWNPQFDNLANGTYEYYISSLDAWGTSTNISNLNEADKLFGRMMITITDTSRECEFYLDLPQVAEKLGCSPEEFKVIKAQFGRIGNEWLMTAGASSGALLGVFICLVSVAGVLGFRKIKKGTAA